MKIIRLIGFLACILQCLGSTFCNDIATENEDQLVHITSSSSSSFSESDDEECVAYCPQLHLKQTLFGSFVFTSTRATTPGSVLYRDCPYRPLTSGAQPIFGEANQREPSGATITCHLRRNESGCFGEWSRISITNCRDQLASLKANQIQSVVNHPVITENTMRQIIPLLIPIIEPAASDYETAQVLVESVSRCLETSEVLGKDNPIIKGIREDLFSFLDLYAKNVKILPGQKVSLSKGHIELESVYFPPDLPEQVSSYNFGNISIPREVINNATEFDARLIIQAYSNDLFYLWGHEKAWVNNSENSTSHDEEFDQEFSGKWRVVEIEFNGVKMQNMSQPISYKLPIQLNSNFTWKCVFWDQQESKWSNEGMTTTILENENALKCESTHLTAFSSLIEPIPHDSNYNGASGLFIIPSIHLHILAVLSSVGSALSIAGLAMTSLTYALFRCLRKERSNKILLNLSTSLLLLHLMSVSSEVKMWGGYCMVPAMLLHYFLLTSLGWMLCEAIHMHQLLCIVFVKPEARFLAKRAFCVWGIPIVLVGISFAVDKEVYDAGRDDWCIMAGHLNLPLYYATYLSPVVICLAINAFVFVRIVRVLYVQSSKTRKQQVLTSTCSFSSITKSDNLNATTTTTGATDWKSVKSSSSHLIHPVQIKGMLTVLFLLGVGWTFGLLAVGPFQIVFRYFFCICNAGQGVFIFLFRVLLHPQACRTWRKAILGSAADSDIFSFSSTSSTANIRKGRQNNNHRHQRNMSRPSFSVSPTFVSTSNSVENTLNQNDTITAKLASTLLSLIQSNKNATNSIDNIETKMTTTTTAPVSTSTMMSPFKIEDEKNLNTIGLE